MTDFSDCIGYVDAFKIEVFSRFQFVLNAIAKLEDKQLEIMTASANIHTVNWGYDNAATCEDFDSDMKRELPYAEWGCGQCDHIENHKNEGSPLAGRSFNLSCSQGHRIMCFVARVEGDARE